MLALSLVALLLASAWAMCAAEAGELALSGETEWVGLDGLDTDAAFEDYVNRLFGIGQRPGLLRALSVRILGQLQELLEYRPAQQLSYLQVLCLLN